MLYLFCLDPRLRVPQAHPEQIPKSPSFTSQRLPNTTPARPSIRSFPPKQFFGVQSLRRCSSQAPKGRGACRLRAPCRRRGGDCVERRRAAARARLHSAAVRGGHRRAAVQRSPAAGGAFCDLRCPLCTGPEPIVDFFPWTIPPSLAWRPPQNSAALGRVPASRESCRSVVGSGRNACARSWEKTIPLSRHKRWRGQKIDGKKPQQDDYSLVLRRRPGVLDLWEELRLISQKDKKSSVTLVRNQGGGCKTLVPDVFHNIGRPSRSLAARRSAKVRWRNGRQSGSA
eukprot:gene12168-biopygen6429